MRLVVEAFPIEAAPVVVKVLAPMLMLPKPVLIDPEFRTPTVLIFEEPAQVESAVFSTLFRPRVALATEASVSLSRVLAKEVSVVCPAVPMPVKYGSRSVSEDSPASAFSSASYAWTSDPIARPRFVRAPEASVAPVPPLATVRVPVVPAMIGSPVALVSVPEAGVPSAPPLVTKDPAVPTLIPSAVATPVPNDVMPVPPLATAKVPPRVKVPEVVIGPPVRVSPVVPPEPSTLVTEPVPKPRDEVATQAGALEPVDCSTCPEVPELPFKRSTPVKLVSPATVSRYPGVLVPIPIFPSLSIRIYSTGELSVVALKTKSVS